MDKDEEMQKLPLQPPYYDMAPSESTAFTDKAVSFVVLDKWQGTAFIADLSCMWIECVPSLCPLVRRALQGRDPTSSCHSLSVRAGISWQRGTSSEEAKLRRGLINSNTEGCHLRESITVGSNLNSKNLSFEKNILDFSLTFYKC